MLIDAAARLQPEALRCPFPAYAELRAAGVTFVEAANAFLVTRAEDIDTVLRDVETFSSRNAIGAPPIPPDSELAKHVPFLLLSDEPEHSARRKLVQRAFTPSRLARFEPRIRELCTGLVEGLRGRSEVEFMAEFAVPLPIAVIATVLGVPDSETGSVRRLSEELAGTVGKHGADPADIVRIAKEFAALLAPYLESAAAGEEDTILATIAAAERTAGLPRHDSTRFVMELLIAGNITTTDHIGNSMVLLAHNPELADRLRSDPSRLTYFIEESLRLESPIQGLFRPGPASRSCSVPATATTVWSGGPTSWTSRAGHRRRTWRSGGASTPAWGTSWPGWRAGWPWRACWAASPGSNWPCRPTRSTTSPAWRTAAPSRCRCG
jgi:cytochrome P450